MTLLQDTDDLSTHLQGESSLQTHLAFDSLSVFCTALVVLRKPDLNGAGLGLAVYLGVTVALPVSVLPEVLSLFRAEI